MSAQADERLRRWRLVLGGGAADGTGVVLGGEGAGIDAALAAVYDAPARGLGPHGERTAGLGASAPSVARWLGDIRGYFPSPVVRVIQQDAMKRLDLDRLLLEPELLETIEPDVHLVGTLLALNSVIPQRTRATARVVVRKVVEDLERRLAQETRQAITGALNRAARTNRPRRLADVDWATTIRRNLRHYQPAYHTIIAENLVGYGRRQRASLRDVVLVVDQSGSMASSVVYSSVFAAVLASLKTLRTRLVVFDTAVVDLSHKLEDPVEVLFGTQLGGGTDINQALAYGQSLVRRPADTIMLLISDLYEGGDKAELIKRAASIAAGGTRLIVLLALSDDGAPAYDHANASAFAALGCPVFACTPEQFPPLMAAAIEGRDLGLWAAAQGIAGARGA
ncbi:MAG: VWA domain-containing protein [Actinomycetota bacterium]|nr:VWA domain-containing protein [Actinomycetota bacterium]